MTTLERIRAVAPGLATLTDAELQVYVDLAVELMCARSWGNTFALGVAFLAAHLATMAQPSAGGGAAAGAVSEVKTGDLTVKFGAGGQMVPSAYNETPYGRMWLQLRRGISVGPFVVTGG